MWIVKLALRRPYTFVVMALLILLLGVAAVKKTPTDVFPEIRSKFNGNHRQPKNDFTED